MTLPLPSAFWPEAPKAVRTFTAKALAEVQAAGVEVRLSEGPSIAYPLMDGSTSELTASGYFVDRPVLALGLALGGDWTRAFPIFVHEFSHFQQWHTQAKVWTDLFFEERDAPDWIDAWLTGEEVDAERLAHFFKVTRAVEMDCERRAMATIVQEDLPLDLEEYAQKANAYVHYYHIAEAYRTWRDADQLAPYDDPAIYGQAPIALTDPEDCPVALHAALELAYAPSATPRRFKI